MSFTNNIELNRGAPREREREKWWEGRERGIRGARSFVIGNLILFCTECRHRSTKWISFQKLANNKNPAGTLLLSLSLCLFRSSIHATVSGDIGLGHVRMQVYRTFFFYCCVYFVLFPSRLEPSSSRLGSYLGGVELASSSSSYCCCFCVAAAAAVVVDALLTTQSMWSRLQSTYKTRLPWCRRFF